MQEIKISIIMPVYNAVNYVDAAIKSIVEQNYEKFELILVDDGSNDGSDMICRKYADKYKNVVYIRQTNRGICAARNKGIRLAKGDYIGFADHDDLYDKHYLEHMSEKIEKLDVEIVRCGVYLIEELPDGKIRKYTASMPDEAWSIEKIVDRLENLSPNYFTVWNCLYNRKLLVEHNIWFPEEMKHGQEDCYFNLRVLQHVRKEEFIQKNLYYHYIRLKQSTSAKYYEDTADCMAIDLQEEIKLIDMYLENNDSSMSKKWILYAKKITGLLAYCFRACDSPEKMSVNIIKKFSEIIEPIQQKWIININVLKNIYLMSKKYFLVILLCYLKKWGILIRVYRMKSRI